MCVCTYAKLHTHFLLFVIAVFACKSYRRINWKIIIRNTNKVYKR